MMLIRVPESDPTPAPPVLPAGTRVAIAGMDYRLIKVTGHQQVFERHDKMETLPLAWSQYCALWGSNDLRILPTKELDKANKRRVAQIPFEFFSPKTQAAILHKHYYCQAMDEALIARTLRCLSKDDVEAWLGTLKPYTGYTHRPSRGTAMRDYAIWKASGRRLSVLAHGNAAAIRRSVFGDIVVDIIYDVLESYWAPNPHLSLENIQAEIGAEIGRRIETGELITDRLPALSTIARYRKKLNNYLVVQLQEGTYEADRKSQPTGKIIVPDFPHSRWEVDHTLLPIKVAFKFVEEEGTEKTMIVGKVWCTAIIDASTRFVLSVVLGIDPPSSLRTMRALRMAICPKAKIFVECGIQHPLDIAMLPVSLVMDNGKDFHSFAVAALLADLSITQIFAGVYRGDHKPFIERFFRTLKAFLRKIPGSVEKGLPKGGPKRRDVDPPKPMTVQQLERFIWKWIFDTYHIRPHAGLRHRPPLDAMVSGLRRLDSERSRGYPAPLRFFADYGAIEVEAMFSIRKTLSVDTRGCRFENLFYNSGALQELGLKSVLARINPEDLGSILVFSPKLNTWIRIGCTEPFYATGLPLSVHKRIWARMVQHEAKDAAANNRKPNLRIKKYIENEGALLREIFQITGRPKASQRALRDGVAVLGRQMDLAVACARLDAIDIRQGRKPPGFEELIDLEQDEDGTFSMQPKDIPVKTKRKPFIYPAEPPIQEDADLSDLNVDPIAGFDPEAIA
jgi:transposase InsO family protein